MTRNKEGVPVDRLGRPQPHQLGVLPFLRGIPGFADQLRKVPAEFVTGPRQLRVKCPCGVVVELEALRFNRCGGGCGRIYTLAAETVYVGYGMAEGEQSDS